MDFCFKNISKQARIKAQGDSHRIKNDSNCHGKVK